MFMKNLLIKSSIATLLSITALTAHSTEPSNELRTKISQLGNIKEVQETQTKGMFAWLLEKNGKTLVVYNTPDNKQFIKGTMYDINTKKVTTNQYALDSLKYASPDFRDRVLGKSTTFSPTPTTNPNTSGENIGYMNYKWQQKDIPEALKLIDSLSGAKEGRGLPQDTLYIFYDPNCVWCHSTYDSLRPYVAKGYTIKWLPTVARGKNKDSLALTAAVLQNPKLLGASFAKEKSALSIIPTAKNIKDIDTNLQFLFAYHKKVIPDQKPSVPFGLFLNKTNGKVTHIQGLSEKPIIELMFGEK